MNVKTGRWLFWYAMLAGAMTLFLLGIGGLVTSRGAGMSVPDWPTSYGYNMFALPFPYWIGGIFYEHSHRLAASLVGLLTVFLTRWLGGYRSRRPLAIVGAVELAAGLLLPFLLPAQRGTGFFLSGIGVLVLLAALIWAKNEPAARPLPLLGWIAFFAVQAQGLLGGLRVVLFRDEIGIFHAGLAQLFFALVCVIALLASRTWKQADGLVADKTLLRIAWVATGLIFCQLMTGAAMRHAHAGLAIPDFPAAYGRFWPDTSPEAVQGYNRRRIEVYAAKPITAAQVRLQMVHRFNACLILAAVGAAAARAVARHGAASRVARLACAWMGVVLAQAALGAFTIWSNKAADIATAHLLVGALSLLFGAILCICLFRALVFIGGNPNPVRLSGTALGNRSIAGDSV
jgi:cytochrome c oxidase assembly protein subunit 15